MAAVSAFPVCVFGQWLCYVIVDIAKNTDFIYDTFVINNQKTDFIYVVLCHEAVLPSRQNSLFSILGATLIAQMAHKTLT